MLQKSVNLFGLFIDDIDIETAILFAQRAIASGEQVSFFTPNLEMLSSARKSEEIRKMLNSATYLIPDGFGLKLVARMLGEKLENTVAGIDFGELLLKSAQKSGAGVFLLGGKRGVAKLALSKLKQKYPHLKICGTYHGYFNENDVNGVCDLINSSNANVLIVCRGFPLQEKFVLDYRCQLPTVNVFACLGGALDVWSGKYKRAPLSIREMHLEWLWRMAQDPSRIRRFVSSLPIIIVASQKGVAKFIFKGIKAKRDAYNQTSVSF